MSLKYEVLKRLVKASGIKKRWVGQSTEELLEGRRKQNAKNRIPELKDDAFTISRIDVMGFPVLSKRPCALPKRRGWISLCRTTRSAQNTLSPKPTR